MRPTIFDYYIYANDAWENIEIYTIIDVNDEECLISSINSPYVREKYRKIPASEYNKLLVCPFAYSTDEKYDDIFLHMQRIGDLVCALLGKHKILDLKNLDNLVKKHEKHSPNGVTNSWTFRCLVAARIIEAKCKKNSVLFNLSPSQLMRERGRKFSATIVAELTSLSERVRNIINHAPSVGTYRENILQNSLRKHLPERYHVATGFIFGSNKQIDILIYDRVDYAPVFREGDLVIVPPESVRAVIEVKTSLTSSNLMSAMDLLDSISKLDDAHPPFFKGIFAFGSSLKDDTVYQNIAEYHTNFDAQAQGARGILICHPFQHLTCVCVINKAFAYINYAHNKNGRLVPVLHSKSSASELESQASFFMQSLLSHLKFGGMKSNKLDYMGRMLGADTLSNKIKELREYEASWSDYFRFDQGYVEEDVVKEMENNILRVQNWLDGEENLI